MEYYFNNLPDTDFQRLINCILVERFGQDARITPLRGADGGRDAETAPMNPHFMFSESQVVAPEPGNPLQPRPGRYLFQVKHHRTVDTRASEVRQTVINDFETELKDNVLPRKGDERVNYFFLFTNVPSSREALEKLDQKRRILLHNRPQLHADIIWKDGVIAYLDQMPSVWRTFPQMFAGERIPFLADVAANTGQTLPRAMRLALDKQYRRDATVRFRQIGLEKDLGKLFVDLDLTVSHLADEEQMELFATELRRHDHDFRDVEISHFLQYQRLNRAHTIPVSVLSTLLDESCKLTKWIILEGGPGQGKSTITQMAAQIYRELVLGLPKTDAEGRWGAPAKVRLPFRIELRLLQEWLPEHPNASIEEYIAFTLQKDAAGATITVDNIHSMVEGSPVLLIFDGIDEIGSDDQRNVIITMVTECVSRWDEVLHADLRTVLTTRPPAIAGRGDLLRGFTRLPISPMNDMRINSYVERWIKVQISDDDEDKTRIPRWFNRYHQETHVQALAKNPMQLSVLLHLLRLKGESFEGNRSDLYRDYFRTVIERDAAKGPELRKLLPIIEQLHQYLAYQIHALTEAERADGTLKRTDLLSLVRNWLKSQSNNPETAETLFQVGEERLGLIFILRGEGEDARYGYEVQPIREYFTAAFINEQITGDAHVVFQELIRRSYWREVAVFLAGLRRPNEKADLVGRSRELDRDPQLGWRQDGRHLTLQLLQEGVLSQPGHVFTDAIDYLLELLDVNAVPIQNEPPDLIDSVAKLIRQSANPSHLERVRELMDRYGSSSDEYIVQRVFRTACRILPPEEFRDSVLHYQSSNPDMVAKLRIYWPALWGFDLTVMSGTAGFWDGPSAECWAQWLFHGALRQNTAMELPLPGWLHRPLLEHSFVNSLSALQRPSDQQQWLRLDTHAAVWRILARRQKLQLLIGRWHRSEGLMRGLEDWVSEEVKSGELDYNGLDGEYQVVTHDIANALLDILRVVVGRQGPIVDVATAHAPRLTEHIRKPGILGVMAARTAVTLLLSAVHGANADTEVDPDMANRTLDPTNQALGRLLEAVAPYYGVKEEQQQWPHSIDWLRSLIGDRYARRYYPEPIPTHVLLPDGHSFQSVVDILSEWICADIPPPFTGMERIAVSTEIIRSLVDRCKDSMPALLDRLNDLRFDLVGLGMPLRPGDVQRIVKVARLGSDERQLSGALIALSTSRFARIAGAQIIAKMLRAPSTKDRFATGVFRQLRRNEAEEDARQAEVICELSGLIVGRAEGCSFSTRCAAASCLAECSPINLPPLLKQSEELGLQVV